MGDIARTRRIEVTPGDFVELTEIGLSEAHPAIADVLDFLEGKSDSFPRFDVPRHTVPADCDESHHLQTGPDEIRLIQFAHLVRPFHWSDNPRLPELRDLVTRLQLGHAEIELKSAPTQFLWDALFAHARGDRFMEGLVASHAYGLTQVANEIRQRLLSRR